MSTVPTALETEPIQIEDKITRRQKQKKYIYTNQLYT